MLAPDFTKTLRNKIIKEGEEDFTYEVEYVGNPKPRILWYHNGTIIKNDEFRKIETNEYISKLTIGKMLQEDEGEYRARVYSYLGEAVSIAEIKYQKEDKKEIKLPEEKIIKKVVKIKRRKKTDLEYSKEEVSL